MRTLVLRILLSLPVMIVLGWTDEVRAQSRAWGIGVGVGYGYGYGPYWGGFGPYWGIYPNYYNGFYGNGLSMYGPPVPTHKPIPGVFGGGDSQYFGLPPLYPGWMYEVYVPACKPAALPQELLASPDATLPPPAPMLDKPAALEVEVRLPREDARLFIDGTEMKGRGLVRVFATPPMPTAEAYSYELRAEWTTDGLTTTHTKRVTGRAGEKVIADFNR
jgi:uncharacterized protein (TIGR03000 family)